MTAPASGKICVICGANVTGAPRVKDATGRYYCQPCYEKARVRSAEGGAGGNGVAAGGVRPAPAHAAGAATKSAAVPLVDEAPAKVGVKVHVAERSSAPAAEVPALPERCPVCNTPVLTRSRICVGCHRDLMQMDSVLAHRAKAEEPDTTARLGSAVGTVLRWGIIVVAIAAVAFALYGAYLAGWSHEGPFDKYPTAHEPLIRTFLTHIHTGTEKSYDKAYYLLSFRYRTTNNAEEYKWFKQLFARMHDELAKKHGADWIKSVTVAAQGTPNVAAIDDETEYEFTIGKETYRATVQVQIGVDTVLANIPGGLRQKKVYPENGKNRFGLMEISGYAPEWRTNPGKAGALPGGN